jgi:hypothetical protein
MRETSNFNKLKEALLQNSNATTWELAKKEWELSSCHVNDDHCSCGHDILNVFLIKNKLNNNKLKIGSSCINHFRDANMSSYSKVLLKRAKYIKEKDDQYILNTTSERRMFDEHKLKIAEKSLEIGAINQWEFDFYNKVHKYSNYTEKQEAVLKRVRTKLNGFVIKNPYDNDVQKVKVLLKCIKNQNAEYNS